FDVDDGQQLADLVHHVVAGKAATPHRADLRKPTAVAGALEHRLRDERGRFRQVELQSPAAAASGDVRRDVDEELLGLAWGELHLPIRCGGEAGSVIAMPARLRPMARAAGAARA